MVGAVKSQPILIFFATSRAHDYWLVTSDYLFFMQGCQQEGGVGGGGRKIMRRQGRNYLGQFPYSSSMLPAHNINLVPSIYRLLDSQLRLRYSLRQLNLFRQENWIRNIRLAKIYLQTNFVDVVEGYIFKNYQNYFARVRGSSPSHTPGFQFDL